MSLSGSIKELEDQLFHLKREVMELKCFRATVLETIPRILSNSLNDNDRIFYQEKLDYEAKWKKFSEKMDKMSDDLFDQNLLRMAKDKL